MKRDVGALTDGEFDLLVLGGGIVGAGVALDAVLRGLRVALIDKGDFASGTSSVSSKLVHGGLRYLESAAFRLVYEALHERRLLLRNAPHLVRPLRFLLPFYRGVRVPPWKWSLGLALYDMLAGTGNIRRSRRLGTRELLTEVPGLRRAGLTGGIEFFDAQMDDARLCLEVVRTAALQGARVCNYVEAQRFETSAGQIAGVRGLDRIAGLEVSIRARQVVNATGPWVDEICRLAGDSTGPKVQPTKGVHLVAPARGLCCAFLFLHPADGRVFFVIPWLGKTLIGTTDTFGSDPGRLTIDAADIAYLLAGHNHYFEPPLREAELCGSFVGLRPLIRARPGDPSSLSREFRLFEGASGLLSVAGGKYTTYRHMAEVITDRVMARLGRHGRECTRTFPLDGTPSERWADFGPAALATLSGPYALPEASAQHLVDRYGRHALQVAAYVEKEPALAKLIVAGEPDVEAEFAYQRDHEMAVYPSDHLLRRTRLGLFHPDLVSGKVPGIS